MPVLIQTRVPLTQGFLAVASETAALSQTPSTLVAVGSDLTCTVSVIPLISGATIPSSGFLTSPRFGDRYLEMIPTDA